MLEVELIEAAYSREQNTILELLHVAARLTHDGGVGWSIIFQG